MSSKKRGLGRGLKDLGINELWGELNKPMTRNEFPAGELHHLSIEVLSPGQYQPRRDIDHQALQELADSIRSHGIIQPLVVRPIADQRYEIIAGERRWHAAKLAELSAVPVLVRKMTDETALAISVIENIQREDLNAIEEAMALQRLIDEFGMTHDAVASAVGKSRAMVSNLLRLLTLNPDVRTMVEHGDLSMGHARALRALTTEQQYLAAKWVVNKALSVRETEQLVKRWLQPAKASAPKSMDPDVQRLQRQLSEKLAAKVTVHHTSKGHGRIIIQYHDLDELEGILGHLQ